MQEGIMRWSSVTLSLFAFLTIGWAVDSGAAPAPITTFRIEAAEVHVAFSAFDKHDRPVANLSTSDFTLLRDGRAVTGPMTIEQRDDSAIMATVMTDVSDSMTKALPMARDSWNWLSTNMARRGDRFRFFDFGASIGPVKSASRQHMTSLYDCLLRIIPEGGQIHHGRRALIVFTDGIDNYSRGSLTEVVTAAAERDVAIYAITTYKFKVRYDEQVLKTLASKTGGRLIVVKDTRQMIAALQEIERELRNGYELVFRADKQSGLHQIAIQPADRNLRFYYRSSYVQPPAEDIHTQLIASGRMH